MGAAQSDVAARDDGQVPLTPPPGSAYAAAPATVASVPAAVEVASAAAVTPAVFLEGELQLAEAPPPPRCTTEGKIDSIADYKISKTLGQGAFGKAPRPLLTRRL